MESKRFNHLKRQILQAINAGKGRQIIGSLGLRYGQRKKGLKKSN
jgi:hypothetical protein